MSKDKSYGYLPPFLLDGVWCTTNKKMQTLVYANYVKKYNDVVKPIVFYKHVTLYVIAHKNVGTI